MKHPSNVLQFWIIFTHILTKIEFEFDNYEWEEEGGDRTLTRGGRNRDSQICFSFPALVDT
jgi:hypothetical protein